MKNKFDKIAIIGAGFAGLATAYFLAKLGFQITVFHQTTPASRASMIAAGLLHPFPSMQTKLSHEALAALHAAIELLNEIQTNSSELLFNKTGLLKLALNDDQKKSLASLPRKYENLSFFNPKQVEEKIFSPHPFYGLHIMQGYVVHSSLYINRLTQVCRDLGVEIIDSKIETLDALKQYNQTILCSGYGFKDLIFRPSLKGVKGQILYVKTKNPICHLPVIAQGYICPTQDPYKYIIGSSYEHHFKNPLPHIEEAKIKILKPWEKIFPELAHATILKCESAVRVMNPPNYLPFLERVTNKLVFFSGLGSRGLLYHAYLAKALAFSISRNQTPSISHQFLKGMW